MPSPPRKERKDRDNSAGYESRKDRSSRLSRSRERTGKEKEKEKESGRDERDNKRKSRGRSRSRSRSDSRDRRRKRRRSEDRRRDKNSDQKEEEEPEKKSSKKTDDTDDRKSSHRGRSYDNRRERERDSSNFPGKERKRSPSSDSRDYRRPPEPTTTRQEPEKKETKKIDSPKKPSYLEELNAQWLTEKQNLELALTTTKNGIDEPRLLTPPEWLLANPKIPILAQYIDPELLSSILQLRKQYLQFYTLSADEALPVVLDDDFLTNYINNAMANAIGTDGPVQRGDTGVAESKEEEAAAAAKEESSMPPTLSDILPDATGEVDTVQIAEEESMQVVEEPTVAIQEEEEQEMTPEEDVDDLYKDLDLSNAVGDMEEEGSGGGGGGGDDFDLYGDLQLNMDEGNEEEEGSNELTTTTATVFSGVAQGDAAQLALEHTATDILLGEGGIPLGNTGMTTSSTNTNTNTTTTSTTTTSTSTTTTSEDDLVVFTKTWQYPKFQKCLHWKPLPYHLQEPSYAKLSIMAQLSQGVAASSTIFSTMQSLSQLRS